MVFISPPEAIGRTLVNFRFSELFERFVSPAIHTAFHSSARTHTNIHRCSQSEYLLSTVCTCSLHFVQSTGSDKQSTILWTRQVSQLSILCSQFDPIVSRSRFLFQQFDLSPRVPRIPLWSTGRKIFRPSFLFCRMLINPNRVAHWPTMNVLHIQIDSGCVLCSAWDVRLLQDTHHFY